MPPLLSVCSSVYFFFIIGSAADNTLLNKQSLLNITFSSCWNFWLSSCSGPCFCLSWWNKFDVLIQVFDTLYKSDIWSASDVLYPNHFHITEEASVLGMNSSSSSMIGTPPSNFCHACSHSTCETVRCPHCGAYISTSSGISWDDEFLSWGRIVPRYHGQYDITLH